MAKFKCKEQNNPNKPGDEKCTEVTGGEKTMGKRPPVKPRRRWENIIKTDHQETDMVAWNGLIRLRIGERGGFLQRQQP